MSDFKRARDTASIVRMKARCGHWITRRKPCVEFCALDLREFRAKRRIRGGGLVEAF
jgi:hypothetical protein